MNNPVKSLSLVVGTIEVLNPRVTENTINRQIDRMLTTARQYCDNVSVSSIPYTHNSKHHKKIDEVNASLLEFCGELNCRFVDINDGLDTAKMLHKDGIHLNQDGTKHLLKTLGIPYEQEPTTNTPYEKVFNVIPRK